MTRSMSGTQSFAAFRANSYFNALDGLRAVSILMVMFHHVLRYPPEHFLRTLQENGRYGVAFFFVISGFLICTLLLREKEKTGKVDLGKFYARRALRLLPLYYAALVLQAALVFGLKQYTAENQLLFREKLPAYLFYYSNWLASATQGPFFCAWSLAVEEQFYLVFGFLLLFASDRFIIGAALAALLVKASVFQFLGDIGASAPVWRAAFSYQEPILLGVLVAFALNRRPGYDLFSRWLGRGWLWPGLGAAMAVWTCVHPMRAQSSWDAQLLYLLMTLTLAGLVIRPVTPLLGGKVMAHIGKISYGIYLLHMFVISSLKKLPAMSPGFCFFPASVVVITLASLVYKYFEYPIITFYKRRLSPLNSEPVAARPAPPAAARPPVPQPEPGGGSKRAPGRGAGVLR